MNNHDDVVLEGEDVFPDVTSETVSAEAKSAIEWAAENGIVNGFPDGNFKPKDNATRAQSLTMIHRFANKPSVTGTNPFTDATGTYYQDAIIWGVAKGITNGVSATEFAPDRNVTREQIALFLYRADRAGALEAAPADSTSTDDASSDSSSTDSTASDSSNEAASE